MVLWVQWLPNSGLCMPMYESSGVPLKNVNSWEMNLNLLRLGQVFAFLKSSLSDSDAVMFRNGC